ncbi:hypothetical protein [Chitinophaga rhizophila]|uniref:Uncharacterized protein n=1 Tax=Chitinophaga rhizophila TaxID=2866212 RepID=A0ABS7GJX6_9BACT|nr:hypothetical protein [Chitinophaga rhizophila]MBW8686957.1 hypothetical protein [Chitinophaga rhizophila]
MFNENLDLLISRISGFETMVSNGFKTMDERMTTMEAKLIGIGNKVNGIESRLIDIEQKQIALDIQMESRFYALEVLIDKSTDPLTVRSKQPGRGLSRGRGKV